MLNFNHVYYFHVAATEGSVKGAAERLGVTQPTVSEQIRMLERALDVTLFERTGGGLRLTEAGRQALEHTTVMFRAGERLMDVLGKSEEPPPVMLRVGISASISRSIAADFLMPVLSMEGCKPVIRAGDSVDLVRELRSHELEVVISESQPINGASRGLEAVTLHRPQLVAIARPELDPAPAWDNLALLEHRRSSSYRYEVDAYLQERGLAPSRSAELDDAFLMLEAVARGEFVAFVPRSVARDALSAGRVKVLGELDPGTAAVFALYRADTFDLARQAVELLAKHAELLGR